MSGNCSICLGPPEDPVCIPCGHVYCMGCLGNYVNRSIAEHQAITPCPTCRCPFYTMPPDLTYLPRQYLLYVLPAIRRIFVDTSTASLKTKLVEAEAHIKSLLTDQEKRSNQYRQEIAAAQASALGQQKVVRELNRLSIRLDALLQYVEHTESQRATLAHKLKKNRDLERYWKSKYRRLRRKSLDVKRLDDKRKNRRSIFFSKGNSLAKMGTSNAIAVNAFSACSEVLRQSKRLMTAHHSALVTR